MILIIGILAVIIATICLFFGVRVGTPSDYGIFFVILSLGLLKIFEEINLCEIHESPFLTFSLLFIFGGIITFIIYPREKKEETKQHN